MNITLHLTEKDKSALASTSLASITLARRRTFAHFGGGLMDVAEMNLIDFMKGQIACLVT